MKVDGEKGWIWTFVADGVILFAMRMSRGKKVLEDVLGDVSKEELKKLKRRYPDAGRSAGLTVVLIRSEK